MSNAPRGKTAEQGHLPPGAERFWGQVSETRAGRSHGEDEPGRDEPETEPEAAPEGSHACLEWCPICRSADLLRATTSPEAAIGQVQAIQHEAVSVLKSFLAAYGERGAESGPAEESGNSGNGGNATRRSDDSRPVRDISID